MGDNHEIVKLLITRDINIEQADILEQTPIFYALYYRAYKCLKILSKFCDLNKREYLFIT
jgi:hypothetical protein